MSKSKKYPIFKTRAVAFIEKEKAQVVSNLLCPEVDDDTVVIHAKISGISRGTEMDVYTGNLHDGPEVYWFPLITGYEPIGKVEFVGKNITHLKKGDLALGFNLLPDSYLHGSRYASSWGASAEYVVYNKKSASALWYGEVDSGGRRVVKIPNGLDEKDGLFGLLGGVAYHGVERVGVKKGDTVVIIGLGVIGNCASQYCRNAGAKVIAFDLHQIRCDIANQCGILHAVNASENDIRKVVNYYTGGKGADVVIECSGEVKNIPICLDVAGNYGKVHLQGAYLEPYPMIIQRTLFVKSLCMSSSCGAPTYYINQAFQQMVNKQLIVRPMITHIMSVNKAQKAYQISLHHPDKSLKMGLVWK